MTGEGTTAVAAAAAEPSRQASDALEADQWLTQEFAEEFFGGGELSPAFTGSSWSQCASCETVALAGVLKAGTVPVSYASL